MNFYFTAAQTLDRIDGKRGSIKSVLSTLPSNERKRISALVIETLKCEPPSPLSSTDAHRVVKPTLVELVETCKLLKEERKITSLNLALVLIHDLLFAKGIQAGDGPIKQAVLRHKYV
jgi:putative methyltransferase